MFTIFFEIDERIEKVLSMFSLYSVNLYSQIQMMMYERKLIYFDCVYMHARARACMMSVQIVELVDGFLQTCRDLVDGCVSVCVNKWAE